MDGLAILADLLRAQPGLEVEVARADEPCPEIPALIDKADGLVLYLGEGAKWIQNVAERRAAVEALAARKGGIVALHWAVGAKDGRYIEGQLALLGGCHGGSDRKYVVGAADVIVDAPEHPVVRGIAPFRLDDEFYYRLKFAKAGQVVSLLSAQIEGEPETAAWAFLRPDGGRSFGFVGMHYHHNWQLEPCRRLIVQGILWTLDRDNGEVAGEASTSSGTCSTAVRSSATN